jgi:hypothetical protein
MIKWLHEIRVREKGNRVGTKGRKKNLQESKR